MDRHPLTTLRIAVKNLRSKPFRTTSLILLVAVLAFALFGGTMLAKSLQNGMESLSQRLGADILVAPYGYETNMEGALLRGEPSTFYFDARTAGKIADIAGVDRTSPQLYIATLQAGCCSYPVQLIGYDPETDFIIQPWLSGMMGGPLADGDIVVGSSINAEPGQSLTFFNQTFLVAARLDRTGMGFDTSVFMNLPTAQKLAQDSERIQAHPVAENANLISSVMVKVKDSYEVKDVANNILQAYAIEGVDVIISKNMIRDISGSLQGLSQYIYTLAVILWMLAVGVLIIVFSVILNERKREFSILRALGASRGKLVKLILCEASLVSFSGAAAGTITAAGIVFPFSIYISSLLKLPYLQPSYGSILMIGLMSFLVSLAVGPLALVYAAVKMGRSEIYTAIRESE